MLGRYPGELSLTEPWFTAEMLIKLGEASGALAAIGGIAYAGWRWFGGKWLFGWIVKRFKARKALLARIERALSTVELELTPNGGGSMRDKLTRLDMQSMLNDARVRALMQASQLPIIEADATGLCVFVSRALCRLSDFSYDELLGDGWHNMIEYVDRERMVKAYRDAVAARREFSETAICHRPDGNIFKAQFDGYVMRSNREVLGYQVTVQLKD